MNYQKQVFIVCFVFFCTGWITGNAQAISAEQTFGVEGYPISQMGYPKKAVPLEDGSFAYIEYWVRGEGRQFPNYYIQGYNEGYEEGWFKPITRQGSPTIDVLELIRMDQSLLVVGNQYSSSIKRDQVKMQMFSFQGVENGGLRTVSKYDKKAKKGYSDVFALSPKNNKLLWMGQNPSAAASKRRYFFSVWDSKGQMNWGNQLFIPYLTDKYLVKEATVDNKGNLYLLLTYETMSNTARDTANLPILLRYDFREKKFAEYKLEFPGASVPEIKIHVNQEGDLIVVGMLSDAEGGGFTNGVKAYGAGLNWSRMFYKKFNIERELHLAQESVLQFPDAWVKKYGSAGANFSKAEILEDRNGIYWVMEEYYTQMHDGRLQFVFGDVATIKIDMAKGQILWASSFEKRQRDYGNPLLLSYAAGMSGGKIHFVYLNERGAQGKIVCSSVNMESGDVSLKDIASNKNADYLFFPARSSMISPSKMLLMGVGNPVGNDYKLIEVKF